MKLSYKHLKHRIKSKPNIEELSDKLFQLGHEHEINNEILDFEFTPNRGDCLSINGLLRDLKLFYEVDISTDVFDKDLKSSLFKFENNAKKSCPNISFLKIEIDQVPKNYKDELKNYFIDLELNKNNFFTDISNYISYETGQPTHCYDESKIGNFLKLDFLEKKLEFETLLGKTIKLNEGDLVFYNDDNKVVNLAGIIGGMNTSCSLNTKSVVVECAYFDPEVIIGKSVLYDVKSDASHKFERNTDPNCHDYILRRFIRIVEKHTNIKKIELFTESNETFKAINFPYQVNRINDILGTTIEEAKISEILMKLGFSINKDSILVPSFRHDINNSNDLSEEVARAIGFDNIKRSQFNIAFNKDFKKTLSDEDILKNLLLENGFYEVVNNPFTQNNDNDAIKIDNPLDVSRKFLRNNLKNSLINNLLYNERRQQDSIKLFEISNVYTNSPFTEKRLVGIIASGRIDKNFRDFSKFIDDKYVSHIFKDNLDLNCIAIETISRDSLDTKLKYPIKYMEFEIDSSLKLNKSIKKANTTNINDISYMPISEFPCSIRDLSYSVKDSSKYKELEKNIFDFNDELLKEVFIFDYFHNQNKSEIKIGFRFIFQSHKKTITEIEVNKIINKIISLTTSIDSVSIPGLE